MERTDEDLIKEYIEGNQHAFKELIDRYASPLYNFSSRLAGADSAPDIVQETFIKVWKNIRKFSSTKSHFKTWVFTITRNTAIDYLRKKKLILFSDLNSDEESFESSIPDDVILPDKTLEKLEDIDTLNKFLDALPVRYREVLILYYQEEMTFAEIGKTLGKPLNTVKSHHRRALEQLKKMIL
jgi:RNA polymerase sigma-70 factor (ECF subfamily)